MKKYITGGIIVLLLGGYALWSSAHSETPAPVTADATPGGQTGGTSAPSESINPNSIGSNSSGSSGNGNTGSSGSQASTGKYKNGTYMGSVGSAAPFGEVQVQVTVAGGKISNITLLQKPQGPGDTNRIASRAFPVLIQEAITAQSSNVNIVSGATQDSEGFQQSLHAALSQAQA